MIVSFNIFKDDLKPEKITELFVGSEPAYEAYEEGYSIAEFTIVSKNNEDEGEMVVLDNIEDAPFSVRDMTEETSKKILDILSDEYGILQDVDSDHFVYLIDNVTSLVYSLDATEFFTVQ